MIFYNTLLDRALRHNIFLIKSALLFGVHCIRVIKNTTQDDKDYAIGDYHHWLMRARTKSRAFVEHTR